MRVVPAPAALATRDGQRRELIVKARRVEGIEEMLKRLAGETRGDRHWRGAEWLLKHGFATATPLVLARAISASEVSEAGGGGRVGVGRRGLFEVLLMERLVGPTLLELIAASATPGVNSATTKAAGLHLPVRTQHAIASETGYHIARLSVLGRFNRDGKPSNLIVLGLGTTALRTVSPSSRNPIESNSIRIAPIDTVAIRRSGSRHPHRFEEMLARLYIEPLGCGVPPRRSICYRVVLAAARLNRRQGSIVPSELQRSSEKDIATDRQDARELWRRAASIVGRHGDPRPRVKPI